MRGRTIVFAVVAVLATGGAASAQLLTSDPAGSFKQHVIEAKLDHLHQVRPAAANFLTISRVSKVVAADTPSATETAAGNAAAQQVSLSPEAILYIQAQAELLRQYYAAVQQALVRDYFEGLVVADGWRRFGPTLECIRNRESHGDYGAVNRRSGAAGAYQFLQGTWNSTAQHVSRGDLVGVFPASARPLDQDYLAVELMSWQGYGPWGGSRSCR